MGSPFSSSSTSTKTPVQTPQSTAAFGGATGAAKNLADAGSGYTSGSMNLYNTLFGSGSGGGGTLSGFLNPATLNVTSPTGPFAGAFTNDKTQLASEAAQNAENIKSSAEQSGFGGTSPAGMTTQQVNQNNENLAGDVGQAFTTETGNSYNAALNNFWNATNAAATAANQQGTLGEGSTDAAAKVYESLYGPSLGSTETSKSSPSVMQDIGQVGSAGMQLATPFLPGGGIANAMKGKGSGAAPGGGGVNMGGGATGPGAI